MKKIVAVVILICFTSVLAWADQGKQDEDGFLDLLEKPLDLLLRPVKTEGLVDAIINPVGKIADPMIPLNEPVVTPGRSEEYINNVNRNVGVITAQEIRDMNAGTVQEALARRAGIAVNSFMNNVKDNGIDMRGFGSAGNMNYVVMVDGRRINQVDLSGPDLSQVDIKTVDRIEIVRGPNTVLYGDNATGGVINIITKKGSPDYHAEYEQQMGSYRYDKEYFSFDGSSRLADYFFSSSWQNSDGYRLNNGYEANDIFSSLTFRPVESLGLHFSGGYHRDWYGQPGSLYDGNIQTDGRKGSRFPDSKAKTEDGYFTVEPRVSFEAGENDLSFVMPFTYRLRRTDSRDAGFNVYETNHHIGSLDIRPKGEVSSSFFDGDLVNKLVFGLDYLGVEDEVLSGDVAFTKSQINIKKDTAAIYLSENMLVFDRFTANCGIRGEWAEYSFDQRMPAASLDEKSLNDIAFDAGAGYKYNERSQVYAQYARSYRFPATDEYFQSAYETFDWWTWSVAVFPATLNFDLKQQVANNYEIGIKDNTFEKLRVKADYFFMDTKNEIYYDPLSFSNENYHHTLHHGIEGEAELDITDWLTGFLNYTYTNASFKGGKYGGYSIPLVPSNVMSGGLRMEPIDRLVIELDVEYVGRMVIANDVMSDSSLLKARTTMDLSASYEYRGMRFFVLFRNLTRARYFSNATRNFLGNTAFYPAPQSSIEGGASIRF